LKISQFKGATHTNEHTDMHLKYAIHDDQLTGSLVKRACLLTSFPKLSCKKWKRKQTKNKTKKTTTKKNIHITVEPFGLFWFGG